MKKLGFLFVTTSLTLFLLVSGKYRDKNPYGFELGTPEILSVTSLTFGPEGILFIGDSKGASIFAVDTKDKTLVDKAQTIQLKNIDQTIAAYLGTEAKNISIKDLAVNPVSKKIYCAIQAMDGTPALLTIDGDKIQAVNLKEVMFSVAAIENAPAADAKNQRGRPMREMSISDLLYADNSIMVSGISNQEFGSTFRKIPFPFSGKQDHSSLEIYHAAHGKYETASPIQTFTVATLGGKKYLVASYTCTPLVLFPMDQLQPGKHVKGRTIGEFGAGNNPIDMISFKAGDESYLVMANSSRPIMRVKYSKIENYAGSLTEPIKESYGTAGVEFVNLPVVNVLQMDKLDDANILVLQRRANGDLDLYSAASERWF